MPPSEKSKTPARHSPYEIPKISRLARDNFDVNASRALVLSNERADNSRVNLPITHSVSSTSNGGTEVLQTSRNTIDLPVLPNVQADRQTSESAKSFPPELFEQFILHLSGYLSSKNDAYKAELSGLERALANAERTRDNLKEMMDILRETVDRLKDNVTTASQILRDSLTCCICQGIFKGPTTLKCGHSFCRNCIRSWFIMTLENKCRDCKITLNAEEKLCIYEPFVSLDPALVEARLENFSKISMKVNPNYSCPICRDRLMPRHTNSYSDFKLTECVNALTGLGGKVADGTTESELDWRQASFDILQFLNSLHFIKKPKRGLPPMVTDPL